MLRSTKIAAHCYQYRVTRIMAASNSLSAWMQYQHYLDQKSRETVLVNMDLDLSQKSLPLNVGIIGGGMAGLYSALLLQQNVPDIRIKIFEAADRVGGRVYTHKFSTDPYQYFDTGAMRIPDVQSHKPVFTLIDYLNEVFPDNPLIMYEYFNSAEGNRVFMNNTKKPDGSIMSVEYANKHCSKLGFPDEVSIADDDEASKLLKNAIAPVVEELNSDFEAALKKYSHISFYDYLSKHLGWSNQKISYAEVMSGATNQFKRGLIDEIFCLRMYDDISSWKAIEGGMSRLPELCAKALIEKDASVLLNSKVEAIIQHAGESSVQVGYSSIPKDSKELVYESFDAIILAIPPSRVRMIPKRPYWRPDLEHALRSTYFEPACTMGLRFNSRFWERSDLQSPASRGGRSFTDLPIRRALYPTHGIGDNSKGVICIYNVDNDAKQFSLLSKEERIKLALQNLQDMYPELDIAKEYAGGNEFLEEAFIQDWSIAATFYHPGDFLSLYPKLVSPQGNVFFSGVHLSPNFVWIVGALESAKRTVQQLMLKFFKTENVKYL